MGVWAREHPKKFVPPYLLLQPLKLATSNFVHKLDLDYLTKKTTFRTKIRGGLGQGSIQKNWDPLFISATVEASDSIFTRHKFRFKSKKIWARTNDL